MFIPCSTEHLFGDDHRKSHGQSDHPERHIHRHDQRNQHARNQVAFVDAVTSHPCEEELNAQPHTVTHHHQAAKL